MLSPKSAYGGSGDISMDIGATGISEARAERRMRAIQSGIQVELKLSEV